MSSIDLSWLSSSHWSAPCTEAGQLSWLPGALGKKLTASGVLNGELDTLLVKAHVEQGVEIGRHLGGEDVGGCWLMLMVGLR